MPALMVQRAPGLLRRDGCRQRRRAFAVPEEGEGTVLMDEPRANSL
jgi:hypothetical protein